MAGKDEGFVPRKARFRPGRRQWRTFSLPSRPRLACLPLPPPPWAWAKPRCEEEATGSAGANCGSYRAAVRLFALSSSSSDLSALSSRHVCRSVRS